jgi:hypothetical protein
MRSLRATSEAHHAAILPHVDGLLALADQVGRVPCAELHPRFEAEHAFVARQLVPHMDAVERTLYVPLEAVMGKRHSMAPMREEHRALHTLVAELGGYLAHRPDCGWSEVEGLALRRSLYRLHAVLKMHLAEEETYLRVLEQRLDEEEQARLAAGLDHAMADAG